MSWLEISATLLCSGALMLLAGTIGRLAWPGGRHSDPRPLLAAGLAILLAGALVGITLGI